VGTRQIGTDAKETAPRLLIVHGQQRLTSPFAVLTGTPILAKDYTKGPPKSTHGQSSSTSRASRCGRC
jgi:hypothetical protein